MTITRQRAIDIGAIIALSIVAILMIQAFTPTRPVPPHIVIGSFVMGPCLAAFAYGILRLAFTDARKDHDDH